MLHQDIHICHDYIEAVFARTREPLDPLPFSPDWQDQPSCFKIYQHVARFPLPVADLTGAFSLADILNRQTMPGSCVKALSFDELATLLLFAHGTLNRRFKITWNTSGPIASASNYGRGTASGGGLYPAEIYWSQGQYGPMMPGIFHYDPAHHALERLATGNMTRHIQAAVLDHPAALATEQFLLISLNFWKNAFKYRSFGYHVITQDLGALLGSLRLISLGFRSDLQPLLWFHDEALNRLLGLDTCVESVFAVIPLPLSMPAPNSALAAQPQFKEYQHQTEKAPALKEPLVPARSFQRSKVVNRFPRLEDVHHATLVTQEPRPLPPRVCVAESRPAGTGDEFVALPSPDLKRLQNSLGEAIQQRHSSFGSFSSYRPLSACELGTLLFFAATSRGYQTDLKEPDGTPYFTRLMIVVNHVEGLEPGIYAYDGQQHRLWMQRKGDYTLFLQQHYQLQNYNLAETAAVIGIIGDPTQMLEAYGNRGYRILNIEAGLIAQNSYIAAASLSLGCGAVLGFDNLAMNEAFGLAGTHLRSLLFLLVGPERFNGARFDARFL